jgi:hypothetical protein
MGELDHPDPRAKFTELDPPKGLGEQIRKLVLGIDSALKLSSSKQPQIKWYLTRMCLLRS